MGGVRTRMVAIVKKLPPTRQAKDRVRTRMVVIDKKARPEGRAFKHKDNPKEREYYERATLPDLRQVVQTFIFLRWPSTTQ